MRWEGLVMRWWLVLTLSGVILGCLGNHTDKSSGYSFDIFMDDAFEEYREKGGPVVLRKTISLRAISANDTTWAFNTVVILPSISCSLIRRVVDVFDGALKHANPRFKGKSADRRLGTSVCVSGVCPCAETTTSEHVTRVLEIETRCENATLFLPLCDEFPFEFDSRSDAPLPLKKMNYRGRV